MAVYEYLALDLKGKKIRGFVEAGSPREAREKLRSLHLVPMEIVMGREVLRRKRVERRINREDLALFTRQLSSLLRGGMPLVEAIESLAGEFPGHPMERVLTDIASEMKSGKSFSEVLRIHSSIFPLFYINMIKTAEESGELENVLDRIASLLFREVSFRNRVKNALTYPIVVLVVGGIVLSFLLWRVVPSLSRLFEEFNYPLPLITQLLIRFSDNIQHMGTGFILLILLSLLLLFVFRRRWKEGWGEWKLRIPILGKIFQRILLTNFAFTLASLLRGGVPLLEALHLTRPLFGNTRMGKALEEVERRVKKGDPLAQSLRDSSVFPSLLVRMVEVGERGGNLEGMLEESSHIYEEETDMILHRFLLLLEPLVILGIGVVVGFIVISVLLPIFEMNQVLMAK